MKSLYLRIYATVVVLLLLFAFASGWVFQRHIEQERVRAESAFTDRMGAWAELIQRSLPGVDAPIEAQAQALREWSSRLRLPLALDSAAGERVGASETFLRRESNGARSFAMHLGDGRTLRVMRPGPRARAYEQRNPDPVTATADGKVGDPKMAEATTPRSGGAESPGPGFHGQAVNGPDARSAESKRPDFRSPDSGSPNFRSPDFRSPDSGGSEFKRPDAGAPDSARAEIGHLDARVPYPRNLGLRGDAFGSLDGAPPDAHGGLQPGLLLPLVPPSWQRGVGLVVILVVLFVAVALGAYPVVRRLTRRLEALKRGVEQFGAGQLDHRVDVSGSDEVAAVARSFNVAATRVEALVQSHQSLLANASHELRSPLARMKMAVSMLDGSSPAQRDKLKTEIDQNVAELDALVEEVLLASRLDASHHALQRERIDVLALAAEEAARVDATVEGPALFLQGEERLLRRALRNLLENARRYGGGEIGVDVRPRATSSGVDGVVIDVLDRGPGVPAAMRERIFEPFFRLPGHAEQAGGVGLGLSLVKQIVERHGGSVRCEEREGGGSRFLMDLPNR